MPFEWNQINSNWLLNLPNQYSKSELIHAFNLIEQELGIAFFESYDYFRGQYVVKLIMDLSKIFKEQKNMKMFLPLNGEIYRNIKNNNIMKSDNVIGLSAEFLDNDFIVESEPVIIINDIEKRPDLKIIYNNESFYLEELKYDISDRQHELFFILNEISKVLKVIKRNIKVEIITLTEINENNVELIKESVKKQCLISDQPQIMEISDLVTIMTYENNQKKIPIPDVRPALCQSNLIVGEGYERHLDVKIPFIDSRIKNILDKKDQLSPNNPNIILADLSMAGNIERINKILSEIILQKEHNRVSAILLLQKHFYIREIQIEYKIVINRNALYPIPLQVQHLLINYFENNSSLLIRNIRSRARTHRQSTPI